MSEDDLNEVRKMVDENGEFSRTDFIQHIKVNHHNLMELAGLKSTKFQKFNMLKEFDSVDPESDHYWNEKVNISSTHLEINWFRSKRHGSCLTRTKTGGYHRKSSGIHLDKRCHPGHTGREN